MKIARLIVCVAAFAVCGSCDAVITGRVQKSKVTAINRSRIDSHEDNLLIPFQPFLGLGAPFGLDVLVRGVSQA